MKPTTSHLKPESIRKLIINSLNNNKPLSLLRMGDGEMIIITNDKHKINTFCKKQINRIITKPERKEAHKWLNEAVATSTILGLPTPAHCHKNILWERLFKYYEQVKNVSKENWVKKDYCSIDAHIELLQSKELFTILKHIDKIVIVSPRYINEKLKAKFPNIKKIEWYSLPGEQIYEVDKNIDVNVFHKIKEISSQLQKENRSGQLLIFGAGPFGKILGSRFCKSGGVAVDLGSVFDMFVGKLTRGYQVGVYQDYKI